MCLSYFLSNHHWWGDVDDNSICLKGSQEPSMVDSPYSHGVSCSIPQRQACPSVAGHVSTGKVFPFITHHFKLINKHVYITTCIWKISTLHLSNKKIYWLLPIQADLLEKRQYMLSFSFNQFTGIQSKYKVNFITWIFLGSRAMVHFKDFKLDMVYTRFLVCVLKWCCKLVCFWL